MSKIYVDASKGVDLLWNNKYTEADDVLQKQSITSPRHALHYSEVAYFKSVLSELAEDRQIALSRFEKTIALAEEHTKAYAAGIVPKGVEIATSDVCNYALDAEIVTADACTFLAFLQLGSSKIRGFLNMRRAWRLYRDILGKMDKSGADPIIQSSVKFGAGLFYFIISMIPPGVAQKAASIAGMSGGDKKLGLQYLRECYEAKSIRSSLSGLLLSMNHLFLTIPYEDSSAPALLTDVHAIINEGIHKYPEGSIFYMLASVAYIGISKSLPVVNTAPPVFLRLLVNCYIMRFDWKNVLEVLEKMLEQEKLDKSNFAWSASYNYLRIGAAAMMLGDSEKGKSNFELVFKDKGTDNWSRDIKQQATKFLRSGGHFSMFELMYLTGLYSKLIKNETNERRSELINLYDTIGRTAPGTFTSLKDAPRPQQKSIFNLFAKADTQNNPEANNRAIYLILKGGVYWTMNQSQQCEQCTKEIIDNHDALENDKFGKRYYAMALLLHARSAAPTRLSEAVHYLQVCMKLTGLTWENSQKAICKRLLEKYGVADVEVSEPEAKELDKEQLAKMIAEEELAEKGAQNK